MKTITLIANAKIIVHRTNGRSEVTTSKPIEIIIPADLIDESVAVGVIELSAYAKEYRHND